MNKSIPVIGFVILSILVLAAFGMMTYQAWLSTPVSGIILTLVLLGLVFEVVREGRDLPKVKISGFFTRKNLLNALAVVIGALISYTLSIQLKLGPVVAAGLVEIVVAIVLPDYAVPVACGAFAGMASQGFMPHYGIMAVTGIIAGIIFMLATGVFDGFGGKLGAMGAAGCFITGICFGSELGSGKIPGWDVGWLILVYAVIAAVAAYCINVYLKRGAVMASGIVGVVGALVLPAIHPEIGSTLAIVFICASFAGMSSAKRFSSVWPMIIAGLVVGIAFMYAMPILGGLGGKLGTIAFGSVMATRGYLDLFASSKKSEKLPA
ncbi:MAG: hypothetical protein PHU08_01200 [Dehalococcoidales bacterium]|nr:hypothetical protein [Dehalococcoidales bacterium]